MDLIGVLVVGLIVVLAASTGVRRDARRRDRDRADRFRGHGRLRDLRGARRPAMTDIVTAHPVAGRLGVRAAGGRRRAADAGRVHAHAGLHEGLDARLGVSADRRRLCSWATLRRSSASRASARSSCSPRPSRRTSSRARRTSRTCRSGTAPCSTSGNRHDGTRPAIARLCAVTRCTPGR